MDWRASRAGKRVECWGKSQTVGKGVEHGERRWEQAGKLAGSSGVLGAGGQTVNCTKGFRRHAKRGKCAKHAKLRNM